MSCSLPNCENLAQHQHHGQEIIEVIKQNENEENNIIVNQDVGISSGYVRRRKSTIYDEMIKYKGEDGKEWERAKCVHCEKEFDISNRQGRMSIFYHIGRCRRKRNGIEDDDKSMKNNYLWFHVVHMNLFPVVHMNLSLRDLIINCFNGKEYLSEHWDPSLFNSRKVEMLQVYQQAKEKIGRFFSQLSHRFSLRIERLCDWYFLMVYYVDDRSWELERKIITSFENQGNFIASMKEACMDWKMDRNLCSIVTDDHYNPYDNDVIGEINSWFTQQGSLPFGGFLFSLDSDFYSSIYDDVGQLLWNSFNGIEGCIDYVNKTPSNKRKFQTAIDNVKSMGKEVTSEIRCAFHFDDFVNALGYKEAFFELEEIDPGFKSVNLTKKQWDEAAVACEYLNEFIDSAETLSTINCPTPNMYFSKFCDLYMKLPPQETSEGSDLGKTTSPLIELFVSVRQKFIDKYWSNTNSFLVIAVILDPRFKMDVVQFWYNKIYGSDTDHYLKKIIDDFNNIYNEYAKGTQISSHNVVSMFSLELNQYLNEPICSQVEGFDILSFWRFHNRRFPTLARMARDFLAVPISVAGPSLVNLNINEFIYNCETLDDDLKPALLWLATYLMRPKEKAIF